MQNMHDFMRPRGRVDRGRRRWLGWAAGTVSGLGFWAVPANAGAQPLRVAAASDLKFVLPRLLASFQQETGIRVEASFGSSGNFARQIQQGLPVELFMSADESWVDQLVQAGATRELSGGAGRYDRGTIYAQGRIALYVSRHSGIHGEGLRHGEAREWQRVRNFAIANPELAPYGRAARQALQKLGWWERVAPRLVLGENIAQATQFVSTGAAQAGITALSLALAPEVAQQGEHILLGSELHAPLRQRMVLLKGAGAQAQHLYAYLQTAPAQEVFARHGFQR